MSVTDYLLGVATVPAVAVLVVASGQKDRVADAWYALGAAVNRRLDRRFIPPPKGPGRWQIWTTEGSGTAELTGRYRTWINARLIAWMQNQRFPANRHEVRRASKASARMEGAR